MRFLNKKTIFPPGRYFCTVLFLFQLGIGAHAQLRIVPLPYKSSPELQKNTRHESKRTKAEAPLTLPFFDDFSKPTRVSEHVMFPDTTLWENAYTVWVNSGIAKNPLSTNVATFDGIDSTGAAYNPNDSQISGYTDSLVSKKIDLSVDANDNPVLLSHRDSVFLSFYYQWRGFGETPDANDYLQVQFRNNLNQWINVDTIYVSEDQKDSLFYTALIKVDGEQFFHPGFQFRIRSFGVQSGPFDTWNIDYVYLNNFRDKNDIEGGKDISFPDQAISSPLTAFLPNQYRAMPYNHFLAAPGALQPQFDIYNFRNSPEPLTYQVSGEYTSYTEGIGQTSTVTTPELNIDDAGSVLQGFSNGTVTVEQLPDISDPLQFPPTADSLVIDYSVRLFTGDNQTKLGDRADDYTYQYEPLDFRVNDTLTTRFTLSDYYAYDDGHAEYAVELIESGNVVAYEFQLPEGLEESLTLLEYIDVYFPPYGVSSNQTVDFFIFKEHSTGGKPGESLLRIPSVVARSQGINTFQRIKFLPALQMTDRKFYIGWRHPVEGRVYVGLDFSNETSSKMFVNTTGGITPDKDAWVNNTTVSGSLMLRPVFGIGIADPTTGIEDESTIALYPNPNNGSFYMEEHAGKLEILSITGQSIPFRSESVEQKKWITVDTEPGIYILRYSKGKQTKTQKIIITEH